MRRALMAEARTPIEPLYSITWECSSWGQPVVWVDPGVPQAGRQDGATPPLAQRARVSHSVAAPTAADLSAATVDSGAKTLAEPDLRSPVTSLEAAVTVAALRLSTMR